MVNSNEIEEGAPTALVHHMAGIIPVAGQPLDFNFPWHDSLMPIGQDYLAVERSVYECAAVGCKTIWIVCHKEMQPLIRHRVGEWVWDPSSTFHAMSKTKVRFPTDYKKRIPIYYVPIHPKDRDKRDCLSWSVIYGVMRAYNVSKTISQWTVPDRYYVSFPYGVYSVNVLKDKRWAFKEKKNVFIKYGDETIKDGQYLGFTLMKEDFSRYRKVIREGTNYRKPGADWDEKENKMIGENLPPEERWSARHFTLDKVFGSAILEEAKTIEVPWYHKIDNWDSYCEYLASEERKRVTRPSYILKYREWNPLGVDDNE